MPRPNPFVGPRPIPPGQRLHGRARELRELYHRLQARRIVVLHAPSGAGKSSLVHAGLAPMLLTGGFDVWGPIRVNLDPAGLAGVAAGTNRYVLSTMASIEERVAVADRLPLHDLAAMDLGDYLRSRSEGDGAVARPVVLLFDQFEEILTIDAGRATAEKHAFFEVLGRALELRTLWALFVIREDHLGGLAPYRDSLPTRLAHTFRLEPLAVAGAEEAAERIAADGGRTFPAAAQLVRDLAAIRVARPDHRVVTEAGESVEPVLLQVVCHRLWTAIPDEVDSIEAHDLDAFGDVADALSTWYAGVVEGIADGDAGIERALREWVGRRLIVGGLRAQVRREPERAGGLRDELVTRLVDSHLVRAEPRAGTTWFELSHDRLVDAVRADNEAWERRMLHSFQAQARIWEEAKHDPSLLLRADALDGAARWADAHADRLSLEDRAFLAASRRLRDEESARRRQERRFTLAVAGVAVVATVLGIAAWRARDAEALEHRIALSQRLGLRSRQLVDVDLDLALLLAAESFHLSDTVEARGSLQAALLVEGARDCRLLHGPDSAVAAFSFSDGAATLTARYHDGSARTWDVATGQPTGADAPAVTRAAGVRDQRVIASPVGAHAVLWGTGPGLNVLGSLEGGAPTPAPFNPLGIALAPGGDAVAIAGYPGVQVLRLGQAEWETIPGAGETRALAWSADGGAILTGDSTGRLTRWARVAEAWAATPIPWTAPAEITAIATGPGDQLAVADVHGGLALGDLSRAAILEPEPSPAPWRRLTWSPDGQMVVATGDDGVVRTFHPATPGGEAEETRLLTAAGSALGVSPDGRWVAAGDVTGGVSLCTAAETQAIPRVPGVAEAVRALAVGGGEVAYTVGDSTARVMALQPDGLALVTQVDHGSRIRALDLSSDGHLLATASDAEGTVRLWHLPDGAPVGSTLRDEAFPRPLFGIDLSPDGRFLAAVGPLTARMWDVATGTPLPAVDADIGLLTWNFEPGPESGRVALRAPDDLRPLLIDVRTGGRAGSPTFAAQPGHPTLGTWFSADARRLATMDTFGALQVWDAAVGQPASDWFGRSAPDVVDVAFSPDFRRLFVARRGPARLQVWDLYTAMQIGADLALPGAAPVRIWLDGPEAVRVVDAQGAQLRIDLDASAWQARACHIANRSLSPVEWSRNVGAALPYDPVCRPPPGDP